MDHMHRRQVSGSDRIVDARHGLSPWKARQVSTAVKDKARSGYDKSGSMFGAAWSSREVQRGDQEREYFARCQQTITDRNK